MNKDELVRKLAEEFGISTIDIYQLVNTVIGSMSSALSKGKNINISEFGKFKTLTRKDDAGNTVKTVSFSPVKKFASEVNFRYNDLNPTPIGLSKEEDVLEEVYEEEIALIEEVSDNITFDTKNSSVNINPSVMDNKDKYDGNIIRDEISKDISNDPSDAINAFINSKLEKPQDTENTMDSGIKEFELPHTLIELHNDITNEEDETESIELPEINDSIDIESLIEERKKALGDITTEQESEPIHEQTNNYTEENIQTFQTENRDNLEEFKSFEEERNAELSKIIAERNKIIDDIHEMVNNADDIPEMKEPPLEEKTFEEKPFQINQPEPIDEKPVMDLPPLQEDKTFEHKFQYEVNIQDNFDPIVTDDENNNSKDNVFTQEIKYNSGDITPPPIVTENIKIEEKRVDNPPTSFEDVFETKDNLEKQKEIIHSSIPPVNREKNAAPPPLIQNIQKPQAESYRQRMQRREQMYEESSKKSKKKGLWITALVLGFIILVIYLAYNTGTFTPPADQNSSNQQNNSEQQNTDQNNEKTPPPVANEKTEGRNEDTKQENQKTNEQTPPTSTNTPEEVTFDNALSVAFVITSDGIYIQTASLKSKSDADKMAAGINKGNKEVFVKEADLGDKGKYFRVRVGKFASMEEAKEFAGKLN